MNDKDSIERQSNDTPKPTLSPDSEGLGYWGNERHVIGCVDNVNGPGAVECPGYTPTRYELRVLAKHWADVSLRTSVDCFLMACAGSSDSREIAFADRRFGRIAEQLGDDEAKQIWGEVEAVERDRLGERYWRVFQEGSQEETEEVQREIHEYQRGCHPA